MRWVTPADGKGLLEDFVVTWGMSRFDVDRPNGLLSGVRASGADDWAMGVGSPRARCYEETPDGDVDHGPVIITGGLYHYRLTGSADADTVTLAVASPDATLQMQFAGDGNPMCQGLLDWGREMSEHILRMPFELPPLTTQGVDTVDIVEDGFEIHLHRTI